MDALFELPGTTLNVCVIEGGSAIDRIARDCSFFVKWHPLPHDEPHAVLTELEWLVDDPRVEDPQARTGISRVYRPTNMRSGPRCCAICRSPVDSAAEFAMQLFRCYRLDVGEAAAVAAVHKLHPSGDIGEERIVGTDAHVDTRLDAGTALANDD